MHIWHGELTIRNVEFNSMTGCCARCNSARLKLVMLCSTRALLNRSFVCIWGVTRRVLHRWIRAGEVRAWKTDKYTIVDLESLEAKVTRNPK